MEAANSTSMRHTMQLTSLGPFDENRDDRRKRTLWFAGLPWDMGGMADPGTPLNLAEGILFEKFHQLQDRLMDSNALVEKTFVGNDSW